MIDGMLDQTRAEPRAPERDMKKLRAGIERLVTGLNGRPERAARGGKPTRPDRRYRLCITLFPLDLEER